MCCVRKLVIFHRKCDWPEMERVFPMNPAMGFHRKYGQVHAFLASAIFPFSYASIGIKRLKVRCVVSGNLAIFHGKWDWYEEDRLFPANLTIGSHEKYQTCMIALFGVDSSLFKINIHKNTQSPICCVRKLEIFGENGIGRRWIEGSLWTQRLYFMRNTHLDSPSLFWQFFPAIGCKSPQKYSKSDRVCE